MNQVQGDVHYGMKILVKNWLKRVEIGQFWRGNREFFDAGDLRYEWDPVPITIRINSGWSLEEALKFGSKPT